MTDEQLEKKISEEFEKWWKDQNLLYPNIYSDAFKAAALPLMKKIEELERKLNICLDNGLGWEDLNPDASLPEGYKTYNELQKENEELREALDWATRLLENLDDYEDNAQFYRAKFNLNKEGEK